MIKNIDNNMKEEITVTNNNSTMTNKDKPQINNNKTKNIAKPKKEFVIKPGMSFKEVLDHYSPIEPTKPVKEIELLKGVRLPHISKIPKQALSYLTESVSQNKFDATTFFVLSTYPWDKPKPKPKHKPL